MSVRLSLLAVLLASALLASATSGQPPTPSNAPPTMRAHFIDVGQGAATLCPEGRTDAESHNTGTQARLGAR